MRFFDGILRDTGAGGKCPGHAMSRQRSFDPSPCKEALFLASLQVPRFQAGGSKNLARSVLVLTKFILLNVSRLETVWL